MFRHLRLKLTVLYAGLFCAALLLIGATTYAMITAASQRIASAQLAAAGDTFARMSALRGAQLREGAARLAREDSLRHALINRDAAMLRAALSGLRARLEAGAVFLVTPEGLVIGEDGAGESSVPPGLQQVLARERAPTGVLHYAGSAYRAVAAPIGESAAFGWIVIGDRLDRAAMRELEAMAAMPLTAEVLRRTRETGWGNTELNAFVESALRQPAQALVVNSGEASALAAAWPLPSMDGASAALVLRYPLTSALSPYRPVFDALIAIGAIGLLLLVFGTWLLARGITQPLSTLERAARKLREGVYEPVTVRTKDELSRLAASFNAMIDAIRAREQRITQLAYHDAETRLPNRLALERRLGGAAQPQRMFLAAIGIDRFADVRAAIGYAHAGALMQRLGARLARLAPNGPMARLSSDVLGIAFLADSETDARRRADALISHLEQPLSLEGQVIDVNVSIGLAQPRGKDETPTAMIQRASIALDQARAARLKVSSFDEAAYGDPARNLSLMGEMRRAITNGEMSLTHQPKYCFASGRIESVEALVRWRHPTRGMISPDLFVPMAEETGHVRALTEWVIDRAIADQKQLAAAGWPLCVAINISGRLLSDSEFADAALAATRSAAHKLCFEITETAVIDNPKLALENIERFAANGIHVAIDDYGSGLSSLAYLKQMPAQELKIDKMFVQSITSSPRDALLVRSTIELAHGLGMEVTAEGVETPAAFATLAAMGCDMAQGYLVSRPATMDELLALLGDHQRMRFYQQTAAAGAAAAPALTSKTG